MLAGSMNNDNDNVIDISDSDDDFDFDSDDPPTNVTSGEGQSVRFQDEESTPSSSSRTIKYSNGQYRTLPPSLASGIGPEKARYTLGSGDRTNPHSNSNVGPRHDSERAILSSSRLDSAGLTADAKDNNKRTLPPSFSNGSTSKSTHPNVASESRIPTSYFTNGNSQRLGDNKMKINVANGIGQPSSSRFPSQSSSVSNAHNTEDDDDDVYVYDGPSSHRVLPSSFGGHNSASNTEPANINDMQARPNLENRILDSDERAVYQEALQHISRDKTEDDLPEGVLSVSLLKHQEYAAAGTLKQNYANILLLLLRLRQACDHPLLVKGHQSVFKGDGSIEAAKKLSKERVIDLLARLEVSALCAVCRDTPEDAVVTKCGHIFCYQCIYERITTDENMCPSPNCRNTLSTDSVFSSGTLKICISGKTGTCATSSSSADNELSCISQSSFISSKIQATVDILNSIINTHALTDSDTNESNPSRVAPVKAIVFSQWTGMLDLLELSLNSNLIQYRRLDGTMSLNSRDKAVKDFNSDPEVRVMIMSLKAGNLGLNMVAACHVILLDLWWNPYAEDQAIDRAHRIGQTRAVTVSRLTIKDSVEDRILALQVSYLIFSCERTV
uniref:Uncharacterized protein n=1 Tax=Avena sativa TaxID=4498 RepID=A0ACD5ZZ55_AVESA